MLGEELRTARLKAEITQEKLAFRCGLDRTYISRLEHNKQSPTVDALFRICDALDASPSKLIARVEKKRRKK